VDTKSKDYHKPTILQVVPSLVAGGVERGCIETARAIISDNGEAIVTSSGGPLVAKLVAEGARHVGMNLDTKNPFSMFRNIYRLSDIIREYEIDLVHARSRAPAWSAYFAAKKTDRPFVTTFHGIYNFSESCKRQYNSIMTRGDRVIAVSNFVKNHMLDNYDIDEDRIRVIYRGVDTEYFNPKSISQDTLDMMRIKYHVPQDVPVILLPARMTRWKGHQCLVKALNIIRDKNFFCIIAGDLGRHPSYTHEIKKMIQELKLQGKIQTFGAEPDMPALYAISDIVLSTSIEPEAFGRVVIEAQAMEKIVIASSIGGAAETIKNGESGFHVSPNEPVELADKIGFVLDNLGNKELDKIRKNARKSAAQKFSLATMQKKILDVYKEIL
jgi:glycosyltransferase involved in cell wall biosynthesis